MEWKILLKLSLAVTILKTLNGENHFALFKSQKLSRKLSRKFQLESGLLIIIIAKVTHE